MSDIQDDPSDIQDDPSDIQDEAYSEAMAEIENLRIAIRLKDIEIARFKKLLAL